MSEAISPTRCYVVKTEDLVALNYLPENHTRPSRIEWINRATDRHLSPSNLEQLLRTFHRNDPSPSIAELRQTAGLRAIFDSDEDRRAFAAAFETACEIFDNEHNHLVCAIYETRKAAELAIESLEEQGAARDAISMLWRASAFMQGEFVWPAGHKTKTVMASVTGGGVAGAALGIGILVLPGVGPVAAAGAVLASAYSAVAAAGGILGATGAAMATMLSDLDVDEYAANHLEDQLKKGRVFLAVDTRVAALPREDIAAFLETSGGRIV